VRYDLRMIARIEGTLVGIEGNAALVRMPMAGGGLTFAVFVPAFTAARLGGSLDQSISLATYCFVESQAQGATLIPRLAGFTTPEDRAFYELFTTCKGIGPKRALRAMAIATGQIAAAIADRDVTMLQSLPEIGKRTAETIIATLRGKVDHFLDLPTGNVATSHAATTSGGSIAREALEVLLQLGENRIEALAWIDRALSSTQDKPTDAQALLAIVYRIKAGG
jgi:Holliday junction DNA helicase RuvA